MCAQYAQRILSTVYGTRIRPSRRSSIILFRQNYHRFGTDQKLNIYSYRMTNASARCHLFVCGCHKGCGGASVCQHGHVGGSRRAL